MKCKDCPVYGREWYERTGKALCFCAGKPTTKTDPERECMYGITDYAAYWAGLVSMCDKLKRNIS